MDYKKILLDKINRLLNGELTVTEFEKDYYFFELDIPEEAMQEQDSLFFSDIREMLDWAVKNPDQESRKYGSIDHKQYIEYIKQLTEDFIKTGIYDWRKSGEIKKNILKNNV